MKIAAALRRLFQGRAKPRVTPPSFAIGDVVADARDPSLTGFVITRHSSGVTGELVRVLVDFGHLRSWRRLETIVPVARRARA